MARPAPRRSLRTAVVGDLLDAALARRSTAAGGPARTGGAGGTSGAGADAAGDAVGTAGPLHVLDVGGGTGGFAVPLATRGHRVTVVDPSPDALAALERRAREQGVAANVRAIQGDLSGLLDVVPAGDADVVVAHGVLEYVDDPAGAVGAITAALRPGGLASVLVSQRWAVVVARALSGHFVEARQALTDPDGRWGPADPLPRRFAEDDIVALLRDNGLTVQDVHGIRVFTDLVPGTLVDLEPGAAQALLELEEAVAHHPAFAAFAAQLHVLAQRG